MGRRVAVAVLLLAIAALTAPVLNASQAVVQNPLDVPLRVEVGDRVYIVEPRGSIAVSTASRVCMVDQVVYTGSASRLVFDSWVHDGVVEESGRCIVVDEGRYEPYYVQEYLVQVDLGFMVEGIWAKRGSIITYTAPREVQLEGVLYKFVRWMEAVDPDNLTLTIPVQGPTKVKATYEALVRVLIQSPQGAIEEWLRPGEWTLIPVEPVVEEGYSRLVLVGVEALGGEARFLGSYVAVKPSGPMVVLLNYTKHYLILIQTPLGQRAEWVREGSIYTVAVEPSVDVALDRRLAFKAMYINGSLVEYPSFTLEVSGPVKVEVDYEEEVLVRVLSPFGVQEHWRGIGDRLAVYQPPVLSGVVYERVLDYYLVNGIPREPGPGGVLVVTVNGPTEIIPVYVERLALRNLAALAMVVGSGLIIYYVVVYSIYRQKRPAEEEPRL